MLVVDIWTYRYKLVLNMKFKKVFCKSLNKKSEHDNKAERDFVCRMMLYRCK